jgi:twitching motility protein PilT
VGVFEVLLGTTAVANMIREAKTFQLYGLMQSNRGIGMVTLNDALLEHVLGNRIEVREAYIKAVNKSEFRAMLGNHGLQVPE